MTDRNLREGIWKGARATYISKGCSPSELPPTKPYLLLFNHLSLMP
jgi:hypothetical protein